MQIIQVVCRAVQYLFWPGGKVDYLEARALAKALEKTALVFVAGAVMAFFIPFMPQLLLGCALASLLLSWGIGLKYR